MQKSRKRNVDNNFNNTTCIYSCKAVTPNELVSLKTKMKTKPRSINVIAFLIGTM